MTKNVSAKSWSLEVFEGRRYSAGPPSGPDVPYDLPTAGNAVAIVVTGGNDALDVKPSAWSEADFDYSTFGSFGGGAFVPKYSAVGAYVVAGSGGHGHPDNHGSIIFDFATGMWSREENANGVSLKTSAPLYYELSESNGDPWYEITGSTVPLPTHPYAQMAYSPDGDQGSIFLVGRGAIGGDPVGYSLATHRYDIATRTWSRVGSTQADRPTVSPEETDAVYDSVRDRYWIIPYAPHNHQNVAYLDRATSTYTTVGSFDWPSSDIEGPARVMLHDGLLIRNCEGDGLWCFDPDSPNDGWIELPVSGTLPNASNRWARYSNGNWYGIPSSGGNTITRIVPPVNPKSGTWTVDTISISGPTLPTGQRGSYSGLNHYTRFFYVPEIDCIAWVPGGSEAVHILKPAS